MAGLVCSAPRWSLACRTHPRGCVAIGNVLRTSSGGLRGSLRAVRAGRLGCGRTRQERFTAGMAVAATRRRPGAVSALGTSRCPSVQLLHWSSWDGCRPHSVFFQPTWWWLGRVEEGSATNCDNGLRVRLQRRLRYAWHRRLRCV